MDLIEAQSLAIIDQKLEHLSNSPAEYEIIRRVIYLTGDFEYQSLINFSSGALNKGAAAIAARTTIIVDNPMVEVGILPMVQKTFINTIYCAIYSKIRAEEGSDQVALGIQALARRYPEGIFVIGQHPSALKALLELIEAKIIKPALVIATPSTFVGNEEVKNSLHNCNIPHIVITEPKGNPSVAVAILNSLVELAGLVYQQN